MSRSAGVWPVAQNQYMPGESLRCQMIAGAMKLVKCGGIKAGENVIISCDTNKLRIAECLAGCVLSVGATPTIIMIPPTGGHGRELPAPATKAFEDCDVFILPASYSQTHTQARMRAIANGARGCTMCEVTEDMLCTGAIEGDFEECDRRGRLIGGMMAKATTMHYTSPEGTDLTCKIEGRPVQYETGIFKTPGSFASVPNSEVNIAPIEGTATGRIVGNVRCMNIGVIKDEPITVFVENGKVVGTEGSAAARDLWNILCSYNDPTAFNIAELGLGLNDKGDIYANNCNALGKFGNGHVGFGSNFAIGGTVKAPCHIDISFTGLNIYLDDVLVYDPKGIYEK